MRPHIRFSHETGRFAATAARAKGRGNRLLWFSRYGNRNRRVYTLRGQHDVEPGRMPMPAPSLSTPSAREKRAEALVNPASGLANDYLNLFNEIVMLIEQLPTMPEL